MFIEKWKDIAFGSDYGGDFKDFLEKLTGNPLSFADIFNHCDLQKYFNDPSLLLHETDNNVQLQNAAFEQYVHYEDAVIALTAVVVESEAAGQADLTQAYGTKVLQLQVAKPELETLFNAITFIYNNPDNFVLFEMLPDQERQETLAVISEMITELEKCVAKK